MGTREHMDAHHLLFHRLYHTDADSALVQSQCIQSDCTDGHFRIVDSLCRQRLGELHRRTFGRSFGLSGFCDQCRRSLGGQLPDGSAKRSLHHSRHLLARCRPHHGHCLDDLQESQECHQDIRRLVTPRRRR